MLLQLAIDIAAMMPKEPAHRRHTLAYSAAHHRHRCCIGPANGFVIRSPLRRPPATSSETSDDQVRVPAVSPLTMLDSERGLARPHAGWESASA
jgi:hypothetical protein